nr:hypothetical protein [archaeon]
YIMRATNFVLDGTNNETDIQYYKDGVWTDTKTGAKDGDTFSIGNAELGVGAVDRTGKTAVITANSSSTNFFHLYSAEGLRTYLPFEVAGNASQAAQAVNGYINLTGGADSILGHNGTAFDLNFSEEDKDGNIGAGDSFQVRLGWDSSTTAEPEVSDLIGEDVTAVEIGETDVWRSFMYSALATEFLWDKPTSGQDSIKIVYHGDEVVADVYVTGPDATLSNEGAELGTITVLDSEASEMSGKNLIVVGGNCVNSVAAELLGLEAGESCLADFTAKTGVADGGFLIQSFDKGGKVAILVAGYSATDTRAKAATYLVNNNIETSVGTVLKGTSATEATVVTA